MLPSASQIEPIEQSIGAHETDGALPARARAATPPPEAPPHTSILIVDDEAHDRMALRELLNGPGRTVAVAASGKEALRALLRKEFATILLDVRMPEMDGIETAMLIRQRERSRHTPIIFLTSGYDDARSVSLGYEAGAVDYIVKPPDPDILRSKVAVFVDLYNKNALLRQEVAERRQVEEQLRASEDNLRALAAHLNSVREEERAHISREIHDELGQQLTGMKMELNWLAQRLPPRQRALADKVASMLGLIDETLHSVRRIAAGLRPPISDQLGLAAAFEWQAREFGKRSGLRCRVFLPTELPDLDQDRATALFRVLQELLTNVARHANATRVNVTVTAESGILMLSVEDNGRGIGTAHLMSPKALGFVGMRERLRPFGGSIEIDESRSAGTKVRASIPIATG